jgi:hypothetical protein
MSKKRDFNELNEKLIIASVQKNRTVVPENKPEEVAPNPVDDSEQQEQEQPKQLEQEQPEQEQPETEMETEVISVAPEPPKEGIRNKRVSHPEYESRFIRETDLPPARFGKSVYIRKEYHDRISQIVSVVGGNEVSLFGYIDNVLAHHFEYFQDDIVRSFRKKVIFK